MRSIKEDRKKDACKLEVVRKKNGPYEKQLNQCSIPAASI